MRVSAPTIIREAVKSYLDSGISIAQQTGNGFSDGVEAALSALKKLKRDWKRKRIEGKGRGGVDKTPPQLR